MTRLNIKKSANNTYLVRADSERFGIQAIVFESFKLKECKAYVAKHGGFAEVKTMTSHGFRIVRKIDGTYTIHFKLDGETQTERCSSFCKAGSFVWNMANNHEIGSAINRKMCEVFHGKFIDGDQQYG